jgi:hypothetical protein
MTAAERSLIASFATGVYLEGVAEAARLGG